MESSNRLPACELFCSSLFPLDAASHHSCRSIAAIEKDASPRTLTVGGARTGSVITLQSFESQSKYLEYMMEEQLAVNKCLPYLRSRCVDMIQSARSHQTLMARSDLSAQDNLPSNAGGISERLLSKKLDEHWDSPEYIH